MRRGQEPERLLVAERGGEELGLADRSRPARWTPGGSAPSSVHGAA